MKKIGLYIAIVAAIIVMASGGNYALRKQYEIIADGTIRFTDAGNDNIISYERVLNGQKLTVLCNLRGTEQAPGTPFEAPGGRLLIGNYADRDASSAVEKITALRPYETMAVLQG